MTLAASFNKAQRIYPSESFDVEKRRRDFKLLMKLLHKWGLKRWI